MAQFTANWTYRTPLRTIEFESGGQTFDAEVIAAAQAAGVLKESDNGDGNNNGPAKGNAKGGTINLKG